MSNDKTKYYKETNAKVSFPKMEEEILNFWKENNTFKKSIENRNGQDEFVFYDGPPFANGLPHYGHIMVSYTKDLVARFQTMSGKKVDRRLGWDCHGLPAEMAAEKALKISGKKAIEEYGIDTFNDYCRSDVMKYSGEWVDIINRLGRWVDFENDYKTMELPYMESVINNFKQLHEKGLVYEDYRVMPYSWAAETPLSNFEVNQGYQDKTDPAITVKFKLENGMHALVWTTTPWTLPSNLMLAVGVDIEYAVMELDGEKLVLATALLPRYKKELENATQLKTIKGSELVGLSYEPLMPYFAPLKDPKCHKPCFKILAGEFVSTESGTGIVHMAPGFGEDDFVACRNYDKAFPIICPVDEKGCFTKEISDYDGLQVFEANEPIMNHLKNSGEMFKKEQYTHSYPHCWRTDKPLIYKAMNSWYVRVTDFKDDMVVNNQKINWIPGHIKDGRFGKWLEGARDWSISRNRFWGAPIPVWQSDDPKYPRMDVLGSIEEIKKVSGIDVKDLHRPYIDEVVYANPDDPTGKAMMRRVSDVFDCWFESGSMPYAQEHYPFEKKEWFEGHFPADFIVEAMDQTRGWFYTLTVLGTALHNKAPFKNCICTGLLMGEGGQKLSKRLKNYPDPNLMFDTTGSDALRWFLMSSPVLKGENTEIDKEGKVIGKSARLAQIPFYNTYHFFSLYANADGIKAEISYDSTNTMDIYILSKLSELSDEMGKNLNTYEIAVACKKAEKFLDILNNWYIRRSRDRFWGTSVDKAEQQNAFNTLYTVLVTLSKLMAPLMPFTCEYVYKNLTGGESVHLEHYPVVDYKVDNKVMEAMDLVQDICSIAKSIREDNGLRNRLPLAKVIVAGKHSLTDEFMQIVKSETNVKAVEFAENTNEYATKFLFVNTPVVGKRLGSSLGKIIPASKKGEYEIKEGICLIAGEELQPNEFEERFNMKDGVIGKPLSDNTAVIVLDTKITEDLQKEGIARDFVRIIQEARKTADFNVSDRIEVEYHSESGIIVSAIKQHADYIKEQVLAIKIIENSNISGFNEENIEKNVIKYLVKKI